MEQDRAVIMWEILQTGHRGYGSFCPVEVAKLHIKAIMRTNCGVARYWLIKESSLPTTEDIHRLVAGG